MDASSATPRILSFRATDRAGDVPALLLEPPNARSLYVLAHGAGAGMRHGFMERIAHALAGAGVATFRYEFPYMAAGRKRPDGAPVLEATVAAAVRAAAAAAPTLPVFTGGKSMGGRMSTRAAAAGLTPGIAGVCLLGFPLHPPKKPGTTRAAHLSDVDVPMLFLSGTRDALAELDLLRDTVTPLPNATLHVVEEADHSFHVLKRSGRTSEDVFRELVAALTDWVNTIL